MTFAGGFREKCQKEKKSQKCKNMVFEPYFYS